MSASHLPRGEKSAGTEARCAACQAPLRPEGGRSAAVESACTVCAAPLCGSCDSGDVRLCAAHGDPVPMAGLAEESAAPGGTAEAAAPLPEGALRRAECRALEDAFLSGIEKNFSALRGVFDPRGGRWMALDSRSVTRVQLALDAEAIKHRVQAESPQRYRLLTRTMPQNRAVLWEVSSRDFFGGRTLRVVVGALVLSPWEELLVRGHSARRLDTSDLAAALERIHRRPEAFHYLAVCATTGWEAPDAVPAAGRGEMLVALAERHAGLWRLRIQPDPRWAGFDRHFDLSSRQDRIEHVLAFIRAHEFEIIMDSCTDRFVAESLEVPDELVREAMTLYAREDPFTRVLPSEGGQRLARVY